MNFPLKKLALTVLIFLLLAIFVSQAQSDLNEEKTESLRILFKGILTDGTGKLLPAGKYNFKFLIYTQPTDGELLWQEVFVGANKIEVGSDGSFKAILGRNNKIVLDFDQQDYYLTLSVGGSQNEPTWDQEILPRYKILTVEKFIKEQKIKEEDELINQLLKQNFLNQIGTTTILVFDANSLKKIIKELKNNQDQDVSSKTVLEELDFLNSTLQPTTTTTPNQNELPGTLWSKLKSFFSALFIKLSAIINGIKNLLIEIAKLNEKIDRLNERLTVNYNNVSSSTFFNTQVSSVATTNIPILNQQSNQQTTGHIETLLDSNALFIREPLIQENSLIFITFLKDPLSNWWISRKVEGEGFEISFTNDGLKDISFDYWIINNSNINFDRWLKTENTKLDEPIEQIISPSTPEETLQNSATPALSTATDTTESINKHQINTTDTTTATSSPEATLLQDTTNTTTPSE